MRVGLVCPYDWSVPGGVQTQVAGLAESFGRMGHDVLLVAPDGSRPRPERRDVADGSRAGLRRRTSRAAEVSPSDTHAARLTGEVEGRGADEALYRFVSAGRSLRVPANGSLAPVAPTPAAMARTVSALRRFHPDVVHVHEPLTPGPSLAATLAGPQPLVVTFHRSGIDRLYLVEGRLIGAVISRAACTVAVSQAAAITAVTALGRRLRRSELVIVPNGVELGLYEHAREEAELARAAAPERPPEPTIVFVGRHEDRKGLRVLFGAMGHLPAEVSLDVLGDGPRSAELRRQYPDRRIRWLGPVPDEEKASRLASADLFVAPSIEGESFGVVLLEAMAAGTAVVASDLPGYRLAAGGAARFVTPGDPDLLASCITELLSSPGERRRLIAAGDEVAAAHSMDVVARRYEELYLSAVSRRGRTGALE